MSVTPTPPAPPAPTPPTYLVSCPNCGSPLDPVAMDPQTAPWLCGVCRRGWWVAELSQDARKAWDPETQSHQGFVRMMVVGPAVADEWQAANLRGTSVVMEQVSLLSQAQLTWLAARLAKVPGAAVLLAAVEAAIAAKGVA